LRFKQIVAIKRIISVVVLCSIAGCSANPAILDPHSPAAQQISTLSWALFGTATIVFIIVTGLLLFAIGKRHGAAPGIPDNQLLITQPEKRRTLAAIVVAGGIVPAIVLSILMGVGIFMESTMSASANDSALVEVIGHEWWWEVQYPKYGFATANEIHIPVGQSVTVKLTSADVIHSFWVPQLQGKLDMFPGQTNTLHLQADQPGTYQGVCAEYCGLQHGKMKFLVIADTPDAFTAWVTNQQRVPEKPHDPLLLEGEQVFLGSTCVYCHVIQGTNASGKLGPDLTHLASRNTLGAGILENNRGNLAGWIVNAQALKPGNHMPPMDVGAKELQALIAYLESLK